MSAGIDLIRKHRETFGKSLAEFIDDALSEKYDAGYSIGYTAGLRVFGEIIRRNYAATVRRGLITPKTTRLEFANKIHEELHELYGSHNDENEREELADIALVCFAMAQHYGIDLIDEMRKKVEYNETRED